MFIGRREDGTIYGMWSVRQPDDEHHRRQEEVADDHPELVAFLSRPRPKPKSLVEQILSDPAQLAALKEALSK